MSYGERPHFPATQLGGQAFNHSQSNDSEAEYDRLRNLARQEHDKRSACFDKSHQAYERGDGGAAHELSDEGKRHGEMMEQYNKQASDFIFRENNAIERVAPDTIDLHGQFVEEAEEILENRIKYARSQGQTHLHVIVGKGNHSVNHIQKIKPRVEQVCRELGLQYATEENAGRIYVNLQGGAAIMPPEGSHQAPGKHYGGGGGQQHRPHGGNTGGHYHQEQGGYQQHGNGQTQGGNNQQEQEIEQAVRKYLPRLLRKLGCGCTVM